MLKAARHYNRALDVEKGVFFYEIFLRAIEALMADKKQEEVKKLVEACTSMFGKVLIEQLKRQSELGDDNAREALDLCLQLLK